MRISYYNGVVDKTGIVASLTMVLERIRMEFYRSQIENIRATRDPELKKALPCATFSGIFDGRNDNKLVDYTGVVVLDIDEKDYQKVMLAKTQLVEDDSVYAFFESPNRGLKILFRVKTPPELHKDTVFPQLKQYVEDNYNLIVDNSGKNISRLCFVSSDRDLYHNPDASYFSVDENYRHHEVYKNDSQFSNYEPSTSLDHIYTQAVDWAERTHPYYKGNRNNHIHQLSCILNRAGMSEQDAISMISTRRRPPRFQHWSKTVRGVYQRNRHEFGKVPMYQKKSEQKSLF